MSKFLKKHDFSLRIERHFTDADLDAYEMIRFRAADEMEGEDTPVLECPENWGDEAAAALAEEAACLSIPARTKPIEENTTPSWLWRRQPVGRERARETRVGQIFDRAAGAAAYAGWKAGVFTHEASARAFHDEIRYLLAQRFVAVEPRALAPFGLEWAYGIQHTKAQAPAASLHATVPLEKIDHQKTGYTSVAIGNATIDAILGGDAGTAQTWRKALSTAAKRGGLKFVFSDVAADWGSLPKQAPRAALDLLAFRREDGEIDIGRLRQAAKLSVILFDLLGHQGALTLGFCNLAPLLMAQGLAYDSDTGRATAATLAAIVTAEAYAQSARMAALLGAARGFTSDSQNVLRMLRNHRRAAYGDRTDYEKISVLPVPLTLEQGAALPLVAAARAGWDEALALVRQHGLRHTQVTSLFASPSLAFFLESAAQGLESPHLLTVARAGAEGAYRREIHPAVFEGLVKLGYDPARRQSVVASIAGAGTLVGSPAINHTELRKAGFDDEALIRLENYLPYAGDVRLAFTPFVLGRQFCLETLKISAARVDDPHFDLLHQLGFSAEEIQAANFYCFGRGTAVAAADLRPEHRDIFVNAADVSADARIRMAAAVQGFVSGDADLSIGLSAHATAEESEETVLAAWRRGVKSVTVYYEPEEGHYEAPQPELPVREAVKAASPALLQAKNRGLPARKSKPKAQAKLLGLKRHGHKSGATTGNKRH